MSESLENHGSFFVKDNQERSAVDIGGNVHMGFKDVYSGRSDDQLTTSLHATTLANSKGSDECHSRDDKYLRQGARPKQTTQHEISIPAQNIKSQKMSTNFGKLCDVINRNTMQMTEVDVIEGVVEEKLYEPDFKVYPQIRRLRNFYSEAKWVDAEIEIGKSRFLRRPKKRLRRIQLTKEFGFNFPDRNEEDDSVSVDQLLETITRKEDLRPGEISPITAIVASAGSGKSTLLRKIARDSIHSCSVGKQADETQNTSSDETNSKMVRYIEIKNMKYEEETDVSAVLFGGLYESEDEEKKAYKWLLNHQSEAILYFDGLDQATWSIPTSQQRKLGPFEKSDTANIMYNLLTRNLLPHVKIVITSREFEVSKLPADARPDDIVSLVGLEKRDAERLFISLIGDRGVEMWEKIQNMARRLVNLVSIPVLLVLTAAVLAMDPDCPPPVTITELYNRIIQNLIQVEGTSERDQIMEVIRKLKAMAHQGMLEERVMFYDSDLKKFDLSIQHVRGLMIKVPGKNLLSRYLFEGDSVFFFCHQSLQEFLAASFVAEMKFGKFSRFNDQYLHESRWSVVCTFVSGIIHDVSASTLHKVPDVKKKRTVFDGTIGSRIKKPWQRDKIDDIALLAAIYESNNDDLIKSLPRLPSVQGAKLRPDEIHMFSSIWARRGDERKEDMVDFKFFDLKDDLLDIVVLNLKYNKIQVGYLDLTENSFTVKGLNSLLTQLETDRVRIDYERLIDFRYDDLDWNNIRRIDWTDWRDVEMINENLTITIKGWWINGTFEKIPRVSNTDEIHSLYLTDGYVHVDVISSLLAFFQQISLQVVWEKQIYVTPKILSQMKGFKMEGKTSKLLLDCRSEDVDSLFIEVCVRTFQVSLIDIVVNGKTSFVSSNFVTEIARQTGIDVKVYWWFKVSGSDDVIKLIPIVQENQVENLRLRIKYFTASYGDIKAVIEKCKVKKLTMVYEYKGEISRLKHKKTVKLAEQHSIEVKCVILAGEKDAWKYLDLEWF